MIVSFRGGGTEDLFHGLNTSRARRACPARLWSVARRKLDLLDSAAALSDLAVPPGNRLERLSGDRDGQFSIRVNDQFRICFVWTSAGPDQVEVIDYH